jgi:hypothetical protein
MSRPWLSAAVVALVGTFGWGGTLPSLSAQLGYELWPSCDSLPDFSEVEFLPIFTPSEPTAFVDLGTLKVEHAGQVWKALQFTRDKSLNVTVPAGKWLAGLLGDEWPPDTVNAFGELHAGRLEALLVDGNETKVTPACIFAAPDGSFAIYNVFVRYITTGAHELRYVWRQRRTFYFVYPFTVLGIPDPAGLDGRRVFLPGEIMGSDLDGDMVLTYNLTVQ